MNHFSERLFSIPTLQGISQQTIDEHLKLYSGYVKNLNTIVSFLTSPESIDSYALTETQRRLGFEFDGMRNHEYYFACLEGGARPLTEESPLLKSIISTWGSFDAWLTYFKKLAMTRGIGWAILYHDPITDTLLPTWVDEQHLGHLTGLSVILALDMWEHSYVHDYLPSGKKQYIDDFFLNVNWGVIEQNYLSSKR